MVWWISLLKIKNGCALYKKNHWQRILYIYIHIYIYICRWWSKLFVKVHIWKRLFSNMESMVSDYCTWYTETIHKLNNIRMEINHTDMEKKTQIGAIVIFENMAICEPINEYMCGLITRWPFVPAAASACNIGPSVETKSRIFPGLSHASLLVFKFCLSLFPGDQLIVSEHRFRMI